jgi:hypothetical protein
MCEWSNRSELPFVWHLFMEKHMTRREMPMVCHVAVVLIAALLAACEGGASDQEFVAACLQEGQRGGAANQMLDKELGVTRETSCKCAAKEARATLSKDAYRAMVLEMAGKGDEAREISSKMSESEQMSFIIGVGAVFDKCIGEPR